MNQFAAVRMVRCFTLQFLLLPSKITCAFRFRRAQKVQTFQSETVDYTDRARGCQAGSSNAGVTSDVFGMSSECAGTSRRIGRLAVPAQKGLL